MLSRLRLLFLSLFLVFFSSQLIAQKDTTLVRSTGQGVADTIKFYDEGDLYAPNRAAMLSLALPGLGQFYSKKYWKLPLLFGGAVIWGYYLSWNNKNYIQYRNALFWEIDGDGRTLNPFKGLSKVDLERRVDFYGRNRDALIIVGILIYIVQIVDAHVDAHLSKFVIDENLSLDLKPELQYFGGTSGNIGVTLAFKF